MTLVVLLIASTLSGVSAYILGGAVRDTVEVRDCLTGRRDADSAERHAA